MAEAFTAAFKAEVEKLVIGDPTDDKVYLGPMARREAPAFLVRAINPVAPLATPPAPRRSVCDVIASLTSKHASIGLRQRLENARQFG